VLLSCVDHDVACRCIAAMQSFDSDATRVDEQTATALPAFAVRGAPHESYVLCVVCCGVVIMLLLMLLLMLLMMLLLLL
jgi:hypothetical protein